MDVFGSGKVAVAFCTPNRKIRLRSGVEVVESVSVDWHRKRAGLAVGTNCNFMELYEDGKEVGDARTSAAYRCLNHTPQPLYLMFLDNDVLPEFDAFTKLFFRLQTRPEYDIAAGVYAAKTLAEPLIYAGNGCGPYWNWTVGDLLTTEGHGITGTHMGLTLIRVSLFQRMLDAGIVTDDIPFFKTVREQSSQRSRSGTEDLWFHELAAKVNAKIIVDTSVLAGHYDNTTGVTWGIPNHSPPVERARWLDNRDRKDAEAKVNDDDTPLKLALDLGAGGRRREWAGYRTYTTDIRPEAKPDYCQDTLLLNLPENHFDLVASNHHLEHVGRWDQERVWGEIFKVCKPGGKCEHTMPSLEWAAAKIQAGEVDEHVINVLYGAQEAHGYERTYNLHYFGYTRALARALAEGAGFIDVEVKDWQDDENMGYNLTVTGRKPLSEGAEARVDGPL